MGVFVQLEMGTQASSCLGGSLPLSDTLTLAESFTHSDKTLLGIQHSCSIPDSSLKSGCGAGRALAQRSSRCLLPGAACSHSTWW